jgi:hypothetical protein
VPAFDPTVMKKKKKARSLRTRTRLFEGLPPAKRECRLGALALAALPRLLGGEPTAARVRAAACEVARCVVAIGQPRATRTRAP